MLPLLTNLLPAFIVRFEELIPRFAAVVAFLLLQTHMEFSLPCLEWLTP